MKYFNIKKIALFATIILAVFSCSDDDTIPEEKLVPRGTFTASNNLVTAGSEVTFTDSSTNTPTSWLWDMPGATPNTSTEQNPTVIYGVEGVYNVTLTITNQYGVDVVALANYMEVSSNEIPSQILLNFENSLLNEGVTGINPTIFANENGTPAYGTRNSGNGTYVFNGVDNPLRTVGYTGVNGANPRTIALWIKPEVTGYDSGLVSWGVNATGSRWSFKYRPGTGGLRIEWQGGGMNSVSGGLDDGAWHHVAITFDGTDTVTLYIDGVVDTSTTTSIINTSSAGEEDVEIGAYRDNFYYKGEFDDVRVYNQSFTLEEINEIKDL